MIALLLAGLLACPYCHQKPHVYRNEYGYWCVSDSCVYRIEFDSKKAAKSWCKSYVRVRAKEADRG